MSIFAHSVKKSLDKPSNNRYNSFCLNGKPLKGLTGMMLNLAGVFAGEETLPFETRLDLSELEFSGARPFQTPVVIRGTAANHAGVVMIELTASY